MERSEKLQMLSRLSEKDLTKKFLIPLYESDGMGCKNVQYTHKHLEFGKDVIYYKDDEYGRRIYTVVQVKKTKITSKDKGNILAQITEAFGEQFNDSSDHKKKSIDKFVLLTSDEILEDAKQSISSSLRGNNFDRNVTYIEGKQLVILLEKHLPSAFWDEYDYCSRYFIAIKKDFETIKDFSAIGQKEPVPLEDIYVSLKLIEPEIYKEWKIPSEKEGELSKEKVKRLEEERIPRAKILNPEKAITDYDKLVILGVPGSGKTTLLRHIALKSCKESLEHRERTCVPIPIILQEYSESGKNLREYVDITFDKYQFPKAKEFIEKDLKEGKCKLLFDGFDELATKEKQDKIVEQIQEFIRKYPHNQIIVTSRVAGYHDELKGFTKLELIEFDNKQIELFIENWFGKINSETAKSMLNAINENEQIKILARNPLMISIIAIIYEEDRKLPQKRADLYSRCTEVLLSKWDIQKKLKNAYASEKKEYILRKLAFYAHNNNKKIMTEKEVIEEMVRHFPRIQLKKEEAKSFLNEIWQRSYLLRQISRDSYDFLHLSFQEYFTALELKEQENGITTIIKYLHESWWEEPILLYAGIKKDATALIVKIKESVPEDIFYSNLMFFGKCVADANLTEPSLREEIVKNLLHIYQTAEFSYLKQNSIRVLALVKPEPEIIVDSLINDLNNKVRKVRISAAEALGIIQSSKSIEPLIQIMTTATENKIKITVSYSLGMIKSEKAIEPLLDVFIKTKEEDVQQSIAFALGMIKSEKAIEPLFKILKSNKEKNVKESAAFALGVIKSEKAIEPLIEFLKITKEKKVRVGAILAIGLIGGEKAIEYLLDVFTYGKEAEIRGIAALSLGMIESEKVIEPLIEALNTDKKVLVRVNVADALGMIGSEKAVEPLLKILNSAKEKKVRESAALALGRIGSENAIEPLLKILTTDKEMKVRRTAAHALGMIKSEKAIEPLLKILTATEEEEDVRVSAALALGMIKNDKVIEPLIEVLTTAKEVKVRGSAAYALGNIGNEMAIEPLKGTLNDKGKWFGNKVSDVSFSSLEKISRRTKKRILSSFNT